MGGFGGVLRGLTTAATGVEQGLANRAELERQARLQLLAQRLQDAQIEHLNAETTKALTPPAPRTVARTAATPKPVTPKPTPPQTQQRRAAIARLRELNKRLTELESKNPRIADVPWGATVAQGAAGLPLVGKSLAGAGANRLAQSQLSADQQEYQRLRSEYAQVYLSAQPSSTRAIAMQSRVGDTFLPPAGTDPTAYARFQKARDDATNALAAGVGGETTGLTPPASVVPPPAPHTGYNPKFWHP